MLIPSDFTGMGWSHSLVHNNKWDGGRWVGEEGRQQPRFCLEEVADEENRNHTVRVYEYLRGSWGTYLYKLRLEETYTSPVDLRRDLADIGVLPYICTDNERMETK
jgi:hypothetical protein